MTTSLAPRRRTAADQQPPAGFAVVTTVPTYWIGADGVAFGVPAGTAARAVVDIEKEVPDDRTRALVRETLSLQTWRGQRPVCVWLAGQFRVLTAAVVRPAQ